MYTPEDSPFEKFRTEKLKGVAMSPDALELVALAYESGFIDGMQKQMQSSVDRAVNRMAEQPAQQALDKMAENARELSIQMQPEEPRAWFTVDELNAWADKKLKENPQWAEQPAQQELVVRWRCKGCGYEYMEAPSSCDCMESGKYERIEYYTSPPAQRKPLTDEELDKCLRQAKLSIAPAVSFRTGFRAAEAAHGIKENT